MKRLITALVTSILLSAPLVATATNTPPQHPNKKTQKQTQTQDQQQKQTAKSTSSSTSESESTASADNNIVLTGDTYEEVDQTPSVFLSSNMGTPFSCMGSANAGLGTPGLSIGAGKTYQDEDCNRREDAKELDRLGQRAVAVAVMCLSPRVVATGLPCPAVIQPPVAPPAPLPSNYVTTEQLQRAFEKAQSK